MTVSTPSASELSERPAQYEDAPADIKLIAEGIVGTYASRADETDAAFLEGAIASALCKVRFDERDAQTKRIEELEGERDEARGIVRDIFWMALRYADGRMTYAVDLVNDAVAKAYNGGWITPKDTGGDPVTPRFARDGMSPEWVDISSRALAAEAALAASKALLSEAEKVITPFADWCPEILEITETVGGFWRVTLSEDAPRPLVADFGAAVDLLPKLREATK